MDSAQLWLHFETALLPDGWNKGVRIGIAGGRITAVEQNAAAQRGDVHRGIALPGMANLHSHAFQRGMAGLAEQRSAAQDSFWTWRETMYRFVERIGPDDFEAIVSLAFIEMVEAGFTRVGEFHYLHNDIDGRTYANPAEMVSRVAVAADTAGIALTLLPVFYAHGGFGGAPLQDRQKRFANTLDSYERQLDASRAVVSGLPDAIVGIAPHSLRAVTPDQLRALVPIAGDAPIHIHIAEQVREVEECLAWSGARPVAWLLDHAPIDRRWCLVHATHMDAGETQRLAASGAVVGLCPITEANLGDGLFDGSAYMAADGAIGIGTDSNVLIDMREELRLLEYGQRLRDRTRNVLASAATPFVGRRLFDSALKGGAQALGGSMGLTAGARADIVALRSDQPAFVGRAGDALLDSLIFANGRIADVWCAGEQVVSEGRHRRRESVEARYRSTLERILSA